jgi:hypothetical protein
VCRLSQCMQLEKQARVRDLEKWIKIFHRRAASSSDCLLMVDEASSTHSTLVLVLVFVLKSSLNSVCASRVYIFMTFFSLVTNIFISQLFSPFIIPFPPFTLNPQNGAEIFPDNMFLMFSSPPGRITFVHGTFADSPKAKGKCS